MNPWQCFLPRHLGPVPKRPGLSRFNNDRDSWCGNLCVLQYRAAIDQSLQTKQKQYVRVCHSWVLECHKFWHWWRSEMQKRFGLTLTHVCCLNFHWLIALLFMLLCMLHFELPCISFLQWWIVFLHSVSLELNMMYIKEIGSHVALCNQVPLEDHAYLGFLA